MIINNNNNIFNFNYCITNSELSIIYNIIKNILQII